MLKSKKLLKVFIIAFAVVLSSAVFMGCVSSKDGKDGAVHILALNGPTGMGFGYMNNQINNGGYDGKYEFGIVATPTDIITELAKGSADVVSVPSNSAAIIYNNHSADISVVAINVTNVLYLVQRANLSDEDKITDLAGLSGKTIYMTGQGATPQVTFDHILAKEDIHDVTTAFEGEPTTIVAGLSAGTVDYALLPQPAVTSVLMNGSAEQVENGDLNQYWKKYYPDSNIVTGTLVVRNEFLKNNRAEFDEFLVEYKKSVEFMTNPDNIDDAAQFVVDMKIVPNINIAKQALPKSGISYIAKVDMKAQLSEFYNKLFVQDASVIGGSMPNDDFYLI